MPVEYSPDLASGFEVDDLIVIAHLPCTHLRLDFDVRAG